MKKALKLISNDWHLSGNNIEEVKDLVAQKIEVAKNLNIDTLTVAGDLFDSRSSQKLDTIKAFGDILEMVHNNDMELEVIAGNHDRSDYKSYYSWITPFTHHPALVLYNDFTTFYEDNINYAFMPFFDEPIMIEKLEEAKPADVLIAHFELNGSTNNGIVASGRAIDKKILDKFGLVLLGHYHTGHEVTENIIHMSSLYQRNFGEDSVKGFTILYDDLTLGHVQSLFRPFETIKLDVDGDISKDIKDVLKRAKKDDINLRVELTGSEEKIKAFKKDKLKLAGVDVKTKHKEIEEAEQEQEVEMKKMTSVEIKKSFVDFCEKEDLNKEQGEKYLKEVL